MTTVVQIVRRHALQPFPVNLISLGSTIAFVFYCTPNEETNDWVVDKLQFSNGHISMSQQTTARRISEKTFFLLNRSKAILLKAFETGSSIEIFKGNVFLCLQITFTTRHSLIGSKLSETLSDNWVIEIRRNISRSVARDDRRASRERWVGFMSRWKLWKSFIAAHK